MENNLNKLAEKYEEFYKDQGYTLIASAELRVPWYKCAVKCTYRVKTKLTEFETIILKCIEADIVNSKDIAFVLGLDEKIVNDEVISLTRAGIIGDFDNKLAISKLGFDTLSTCEREVEEVTDYQVYMNSVTGEWRVDNSLFYESSQVNSNENDKSIILKPEKTVTDESINGNLDFIMLFEKELDTNVIKLRLKEYKTIIYQQERVLFYRNPQKSIMILPLNYQTEKIDDSLSKVLTEKYEKQKLLEILEVEKWIKEPEKDMLKISKISKENIKNIKILGNKEIRELFKGIFDNAQKSVFIVSPWLSEKIVTEEFIDSIEKALSKRKLSITIVYGMTSWRKLNEIIKKASQTSNALGSGNRDLITHNIAQSLKQKFSKYEKFKIFHSGGSHEKYLIYDNKYCLSGSFNFLSYDGGEEHSYGGDSFRFESGILIEDKAATEKIINRFKDRVR